MYHIQISHPMITDKQSNPKSRLEAYQFCQSISVEIYISHLYLSFLQRTRLCNCFQRLIFCIYLSISLTFFPSPSKTKHIPKGRISTSTFLTTPHKPSHHSSLKQARICPHHTQFPIFKHQKWQPPPPASRFPCLQNSSPSSQTSPPI